MEKRFKEINGKMGLIETSSTFGVNNGRMLRKNIKNKQSKGFPLTITDSRTTAFKFAVQLGVLHTFNMSSNRWSVIT